MLKIDPTIYEVEIKKEGVKPAIMKARQYKGYIYVGPMAMKTEKEFNKVAKASKKK